MTGNVGTAQRNTEARSGLGILHHSRVVPNELHWIILCVGAHNFSIQMLLLVVLWHIAFMSKNLLLLRIRSFCFCKFIGYK
jgi:hypothetical protein